MRTIRTVFSIALLVLVRCAGTSSTPAVRSIQLTAVGGAGFDDLRYSKTLGRILAPTGGGRSVALIDPRHPVPFTINGGPVVPYSGGHTDGITSVDAGNGRLYGIDRTSREIVVMDPIAARVVARVPLTGQPDYIRFVAPTHEVWVTEPDQERIEIFRIDDSVVALTPDGSIAVPGGPESLVIDPESARAFTHLWKGVTVVIDLHLRQIIARWANSCTTSRGIAYDEEFHLLFAGCEEGTVVVLDTFRDGVTVSKAASAGLSGVDIIDYDSERRHLYVPGGKSATMAIFAVAYDGQLTQLATVPTAAGAHCVTTDGRSAWVCDPAGGRLLLFKDGYNVHKISR
jgi:hypothetical protein